MKPGATSVGHVVSLSDRQRTKGRYRLAPGLLWTGLEVPMQARERYLSAGPMPAGDAELLALVLGTGVVGTSALGVAAAVLQRFGGLSGVARASVHELCAVRGVGPARAVRVHAALQAGRRSLAVHELGTPIRSPAEAYAVLGPALSGLNDEELHGLYLDRRRRIMAHRTLTRGSDAFTVVDPRQIFRVAVQIGACGVVLGHNHPSGDPEPSRQDIDVTRRVAHAGRTLGIALLDHLVVGSTRYRSLAQAGHVPALGPTEAVWTA